jgi:predicted Fe-Mo cluster-binding NifX family protein
MKISISAMTNSLDAQINPRFGRCQYLVFVDSDSMEFEAVSNEASGAMSGAGIQAAQTVATHGAQLVITGNVGPNAYKVLFAAGIKIVTIVTGTVREAVEQYKRGELKEIRGPTVGGHYGMGRKR